MATMDTETQDAQRLRPGALAAGLILLVLGAGMLLDSTGVAEIRVGRLIAPLVLISIGVSSLLSQHLTCATSNPGARRGRRQSSTSGLWMICLGAWLMASQTHVFGLTFATSWPILFIISGFLIVTRGMR
jgi:hypothetical protein